MAGLNVAHLNYIATRPGTVYNPGCGFGLWGQLEPAKAPGNIQDLEQVKNLVRQESNRGRILYRAIVSLGEPDAGELGYYDRAKWEALIASQISTIAREMHIDPGNIRWVASMHCKAGHPHTHILFWDGGNEPRQAVMPKPVFQRATERIRAGFSYQVYGEQIRQLQDSQKQMLKEIRQELCAICPEANPTAAPPDKMWTSKEVKLLSLAISNLARDAPKSGSLKYQYLPPAYKEKVNQVIHQALQLPEIQKLLDDYLSAADRVSHLYGNSKDTVQKNREKALEKVRSGLGNEIMAGVRNILRDLQAQAEAAPPELQSLAKDAVANAIAGDAQYASFIAGLPRNRQPQLWNREDYRGIEGHVISAVMRDARIRAQLKGYAKTVAQDENSCQVGTNFQDGNAAAEKEVMADFRKAVRQAFLQQVQSDTGWEEECVHTHTMGILVRLFASLTQQRGQQSARAAQLSKKHDLSREAMADYREKRRQGSNQPNNLEL